MVDEVVVTGTRIKVEKDGFTTVIDAETFETTPSVTRDLQDILRLSPFVSIDNEEDGEESIEIGGAPPISIDSSPSSSLSIDTKGLNLKIS